ncbi:hypothetical protein D2V17_14305 [Aurantiacibacter xanthus]|uniref:Uncharacterized protein n=1 Tax=Aurantiacibacter xanthus TaxID=1784712 RepID=A0A3A1P333_9SPHN|nr:hypothetical protein [Aurantiacibacter xanthus]RIV82970.1 hypothetical protein D2V17_14305 [Aurantiacibacter xanthus]
MTGIFTWLTLKATGVLKVASDALKAILKWMVADWRNGPLVVGWFVALCHWLLVDPAMRSDLSKERAAHKGTEAKLKEARNQVQAERAAHAKTIGRFQSAVLAATAAAHANVARVKAEQEAITQEATDEYQQRVAALRSRAAAAERRLRAAAERRATDAADHGGASAADLPQPGDAATSTDAASADHGFPAARSGLDWPDELSGADICTGNMSLEERLIASEQAVQLDALISWVERQSTVPVAPIITQPAPMPETFDAGQ